MRLAEQRQGGTVSLLCCVWLKALCFFLPQLGFPHPRPSRNHRWNSPGRCERVFCQVPKIRLHHHPPGRHVSSSAGLVPTQGGVCTGRDRGSIALEPRGPPPGLQCPPRQPSTEDPPQRRSMLSGVVSKTETEQEGQPVQVC